MHIVYQQTYVSNAYILKHDAATDVVAVVLDDVCSVEDKSNAFRMHTRTWNADS